jgi:hypothetical protein
VLDRLENQDLRRTRKDQRVRQREQLRARLEERRRGNEVLAHVVPHPGPIFLAERDRLSDVILLKEVFDVGSKELSGL